MTRTPRRRGARGVAAWAALVVVLMPVCEARAQGDGPAVAVEEAGPCWQEPAPRFDLLPWQLLWQPPLANQRAPRMYAKATSLDNEFTQKNVDTALGGELGLVRYHPASWPEAEFQLDFFGVHFSRWANFHEAMAGDYRYGFPLTFRSGPWQAKFGYEHTSTHLGDDFIWIHNRFKVRYVRDELVLGLSYRWWNELRLYGEFGYALSIASPVMEGRERFDWGVEWSLQEPTGWKGQPFAAFDMDLRPEQQWQPNMTLQLGWQWIPNDRHGSFRLALELYDGFSPYGQFLTVRERWVGVGVFVDF